MSTYRTQIKKFEILDKSDTLLATFSSPDAVVEFFDVLDEHVTQDYIVEAFDDNELLIDTWYMPDVVNGNFKDDLEKAKAKNRQVRKL